jgi:hypothetical protein
MTDIFLVVGVYLTNTMFQKFVTLLSQSDRKLAASLDPLDGASRSYCTHLTDISFATESAGQDPFPPPTHTCRRFS